MWNFRGAYGSTTKLPRYVLLDKLKLELISMTNERKQEEKIKKQQDANYVSDEIRLNATLNRK